MRQWTRAHLTYANVVATLSLFLVLGGGTALASYVVSSNGQVGPGTISGHHPPSGDHANLIGGWANGQDLASAAVSTTKLGTGAVTTAKIGNGAVTAPKLAANAIGARAYGLVSGTTVARSKNVAGVTNPTAGAFSIALAGGIDVSQSGLVVTPDYSDDDTLFGVNQKQAIAEWAANPDACAAGQLEVITGPPERSLGERTVVPSGPLRET